MAVHLGESRQLVSTVIACRPEGWVVLVQSEALLALGFAVQRVSLYREGMAIGCLGRLSEKRMRRLMDCWEQKLSLVVTLD